MPSSQRPACIVSNILSMQSHVAYGYVGNRAAAFPLQRLGHEVIAINTVQFSNHTGYGEWTGDIMSLDHIERIFEGLEQRGALKQCDAVLTGYLGVPELGHTLLKWLTRMRLDNPDLIYCCDPVMGDVGRGVFVREGVPAFFQNSAAPAATIMTPNQFELQLLTDVSINTLLDAQRACQILHDRGVLHVLLTSLMRQEGHPTEIEMLLSSKNQGCLLIATPKLPMPIPINGSGDATAALFLAHYLESKNLKASLEKTTNSIFALFESTLHEQRRELNLVQGQSAWMAPLKKFDAVSC